MKNHKGESRRFAFIGYKSKDDADYAIKYFNGTFVNTMKIEVLEAKTFSDPNVPRSWKDKKMDAAFRLKQTEEKLKKLEEMQLKRNQKKKKKSNPIDERIANDDKLQEFLTTMKSTRTAKSWNNDMEIKEQSSTTNASAQENSTEPTAEVERDVEMANAPETESDDEYEEFNKKDTDEEPEEEEEQMVSLKDIDAESKPEDDNKENKRE
ncbi:unnamed protein product [Ambrosiozyma monospora]|uniref:Unnamed protein product n=1 Tax=Ambrosiozyma monospora TaxID=43982 RepID=A0ACB5U7R2_AMBMO|nr:unnamed protein product [Ambrosiozyma monospora]